MIKKIDNDSKSDDESDKIYKSNGFDESTSSKLNLKTHKKTVE